MDPLMHEEAVRLGRLDRLIWVIVTVVGAVVLAAPALSNFIVEWSGFFTPAIA